MGLKTDLPLWMFKNIIHQQRHDFIALAPFWLKVQRTLIIDFGRMFFRPLQVVAIVHNDFQFVRMLVVAVFHQAVFLGLKVIQSQ